MTNGNTYVKWSIMSFLLTILILVLGVLWNEIRSVREAELNSREDISTIKTDVVWIKSLISRGEVSIFRNGYNVQK